LPNDARGRLDPDQVAATIRGENVHFPTTALVCIENTHNRCGGAALGPEEIAPVAAVARERGVALHIDGARIFNAAVARGVPAADLVAAADSVTFCLSKGLACPVGSLLCGDADFIARARRNRKMLGGGMRQAGILAAAGLVALDTMIDRLAEDHANARALARGLAELPGIEIDPDAVETNILFLRTTDEPAPALSRRLAEVGVLANAGGASSIRMVTHYGIERADIDEALARISRLVRPVRVVVGATHAAPLATGSE
jgi:threonine aldolase